MIGAVIPVRATINLPGLVFGARADVDPEKPYIKTCLDNGYLVAEPQEESDDRNAAS